MTILTTLGTARTGDDGRLQLVFIVGEGILRKRVGGIPHVAAHKHGELRAAGALVVHAVCQVENAKDLPVGW